VKGFAAALLTLLSVTGIMKAEDPMLSQSKVFSYASAPTRSFANGGGAHDIVLGALKTGEAVRVHESMQPQGAVPNPAHAIDHSEFIIVQEGTLAFIHDGVTETAGPGDVIYVALGTMHQVKNIGQGAVKYAIVSIGGDIKPNK
jgi:quercetin dioxygenase-like cupin family protein